jgi:hypothetical protein
MSWTIFDVDTEIKVAEPKKKKLGRPTFIEHDAEFYL